MSDEYGMLHSSVVLVGVVVDMVLPIREPNVGGIGNRRRRNPYTANHYALPMCQANLLNIPL